MCATGLDTLRGIMVGICRRATRVCVVNRGLRQLYHLVEVLRKLLCTKLAMSLSLLLFTPC